MDKINKMKPYTAILCTLALAACVFSCKNPSVNAGSTAESGLKAKAGSLTPDATEPVPAAGTAPLVVTDKLVPDIKFLSHGNIIPSSGSLDLLFSSVGYASAQVRIKKVFQSNILQYMQSGSGESMWDLYKVARQIADTTLVLGSPDAPHIRENRTYSLCLDEMIKPDQGAVYHVEIRGREPLVAEDFWDSDSYFGNYETYRERSVDLLASDIVLLAKSGDDATYAFVYNIITGKPVSGARVKLFDFVQQELGKGVSDKDGRVRFPANPEGRFLTASSGKDCAMLDLRNEKALSTSSFDTGGTEHKDGIKVFLFGERGVWRPGDTLHVSAVAMFEGKELPAGHPVTACLRNPDGQVTATITQKYDGSCIWHFPFRTQEDAPTGRWRVDLTIGGQTFSKALRVETVKPNRLDIGLDFGRDKLTASADCKGTVSVSWLYGAVGSGLKVNADLDLSAAATGFKGYESFCFTDQIRKFQKTTLHYKDQLTDAKGNCGINTDVKLSKENVPGFLNAGFTLRAFEPSGEFSTAYHHFVLSPFSTYVGLKTEMDRSGWGEEFLRSKKEHRFDVVALDAGGKGVDARLRAEICHVDWSWWWESSAHKAAYMSGNSREVFLDTTVSVKDGKGSFTYGWDDAPQGLYYIRITDMDGGHASSMLCEVWNESPESSATDGFTRLTLNINRESFKTGETARLTFPSAAGATALVSLEKGGRILRTDRVECYDGSTEVQIPVTSEMTPNVYACVTLIQPHKRTLNDAPIRMYGVQNINVEDAGSHLQPTIDIASEIKPESTVGFKVAEKNGRKMDYIVAIVDEGLLSLTGFRTPDAWNAFHAKEALRVRTWDRYDDIVGAYGGKIERLFSIGGDDEASGPIKRKGADRFPPVVKYLGPFTLKAGKTARHSVEIPQYIGQLRAMVIATDGKAQGSAQKEVNVTKPLMVQASLPRTVSVGESIKVPVTLMTLKPGVGQVKLSIKTDGAFSVAGPATRSVTAPDNSQSVEYFELKAGDAPAVGHVTVTAESASDKSVSRVEVDVLNPNPETVRLQSELLQPGRSKEFTAELFGAEGTNSLSVELSVLPPADLAGRLDYLTGYPYGCVEQTISGAFPQIFIARCMEGDDAFIRKCSDHVKAAITRMQSFRCADGSLSYWPGSGSTSAFGTVYALHFLQEARNAGYAVSDDLLKSLIDYVASSVVNDQHGDMTVRTYGLYALAIAGKPQRGTMNVLREKTAGMPVSAAWLLAAAYAADGKQGIAAQLCENLVYNDGRYESYGSEDRNMAVALRTAVLCAQKERAFKLATDIAARLGDTQHFMSTQSTAWALYALCDYARANVSDGIRASITQGRKDIAVESSKSLVSRELALTAQSGETAIKVTNKGTGPLNVIVKTRGAAPAGREIAAASGLRMSVGYIDDDETGIRVDTLSRGRSFKAVVTVENTGASAVGNLALSHRFPSGWEIRNTRMYSRTAPAGITYQDFRDDRVCSFFDLAAGGSVTVTIDLTATYPGRFCLPAVSCAAMYDDTINATVPGGWVEVF